MSTPTRSVGGRLPSVLLILVLGVILVVLAVRSRANGRELAELSTRVEKAERTAEDLGTSAADLEARLRASERALSEARAEGEARAATVKELSDRLAKATADLERVSAERDEHLAARLDVERRAVDLESALAQATRSRRIEVESLARQLEEVGLAAEDWQRRSSRLAEQLALREAEAKQAAERLVALGADAKAAAAAHLREIDALRTKLTADFERTIAGLREDLRSAEAAREEISRRMRELLERFR